MFTQGDAADVLVQESPEGERTRQKKAKAKAKVHTRAKSAPKPFHVDRTGGNWKVWNRVGSWRHMMEAGVQGVSQATTAAAALQNTMAVGSTPHQFAAEEQQKLEEKAVKNQADVEGDVDEAKELQDQRTRFRW